MRSMGFDPDKNNVKTKVLKKREEMREEKQTADSANRAEKKFMSKDEFVEIIAEQVAAKNPEQEVRRAFRVISGGNQHITAMDLWYAAGDMGLDVEPSDLESMMNEAGASLDGEISEDAFVRLLLMN